MRPVVSPTMQYLSDEWMTAAAADLAASESLREATSDAELTIQYEVAGAPGGKAAYGISFDHGTVALEPGPHKDAQVRFELDYSSASAIASGELSAQAAFMQGKLKLGGDVSVLVRQHALLDGLGDALGDLRERTEF